MCMCMFACVCVCVCILALCVCACVVSPITTAQCGRLSAAQKEETDLEGKGRASGGLLQVPRRRHREVCQFLPLLHQGCCFRLQRRHVVRSSLQSPVQQVPLKGTTPRNKKTQNTQTHAVGGLT